MDGSVGRVAHAAVPGRERRSAARQASRQADTHKARRPPTHQRVCGLEDQGVVQEAGRVVQAGGEVPVPQQIHVVSA